MLDAAVQVIIERGVEATRFVDVSEASGVPVASLQYYFGSRDDLLLAAFRHGSDVTIEAVKAALAEIADPWGQLLYIIDSQLPIMTTSATRAGCLEVEIFRAALRDPDLRLDLLMDYSGWRAVLAGALRHGIEGGEFAPGIDPEQVAIQVLAVLDGLAQPMAIGDTDLTPALARRIAIEMVATLTESQPPPGAIDTTAGVAGTVVGEAEAERRADPGASGDPDLGAPGHEQHAG